MGINLRLFFFVYYYYYHFILLRQNYAKIKYIIKTRHTYKKLDKNQAQLQKDKKLVYYTEFSKI